MVKTFFITFVLFIVLDFIWFGFVVKDFNFRQLSEIGRIENGNFSLNYPAALFSYILMSVAIVVFVLPRVETLTFAETFGIGALMGLIVYGVFDTTNLAILKNYPLKFALADMAWGTFVFGAVTVIVKKLTAL